MRPLAASKIPRPTFSYEAYNSWRIEPHIKFAIEIGCGVGYHPIKWAQKNPQSQILAIERTTEKFLKFNNRLSHHPHLANIFPAHADAAVLLPHLIQSAEVDEYYVLYPNPYPKERHKNLRFAHSSLTRFISQTLKKNGHLTIATNIEAYAKELLTELPAADLSLVEYRILPPTHVPRSHFEKKYIERGESCHNLVFRRIETSFK